MTATATFAPTTVRVEVLTSLAELYALQNEWEQLQERVRQSTIYQSWAWVVSWYEHFGHDKDLLVLVVRTGSGQLVGIAPCSRARDRGRGIRLVHLLGRGKDATEYADVLLDPEYAESATGALIELWTRVSARWDLLVLPCVPVDSPFALHLRRLATDQGFQVLVDEHPQVVRPLTESWQSFYSSLGTNMRKHLKKFANRLSREGHEVEMVVVEGGARLDEALEVFLRLHESRAVSELNFRHESRFQSPSHKAFLRTMARRLAERGQLWVCLLRVDGQFVAAQICFPYQQKLYAYYSGYDPGWAWYAVMMFLFRRCIERAIEYQFEEFDLGLGLDQEKLRWGGETRLVANLTLASPRLRSRLALLLFQLHKPRGHTRVEGRDGSRPLADRVGRASWEVHQHAREITERTRTMLQHKRFTSGRSRSEPDGAGTPDDEATAHA